MSLKAWIVLAATLVIVHCAYELATFEPNTAPECVAKRCKQLAGRESCECLKYQPEKSLRPQVKQEEQ